MQETDSDLGDDLDELDPDTDHQELLQPVEWLQPSCSSGGTYNVGADALSTETGGKIECLTCFKQFPIDEVSLHADECADAFWKRVGGESEIIVQNNIEDGLSQKDLKSEILQLRLRHLKEKEEAVRVTVWRKKIWDDFKRSRERYYTPDRILKVTFSGEPSVDSGGPKWEFFTGIVSFSFTNENYNLTCELTNLSRPRVLNTLPSFLQHSEGNVHVAAELAFEIVFHLYKMVLLA